MRLRVLLACVVVPLAVLATLVVPKGSTAASLSEIQKKAQETQRKIGAKKAKEQLLTNNISRYTAKIRRLQSKITRYSARETKLQADLDVKSALLAKTQTALRKERGRTVRLRKKLADDLETLARRLQELYMADSPDLVTVLLSSKGFADLLEREEFLSRISAQDRVVIRRVKRARVEAKANAARLDVLERQRKQTALVVMRRRDEIARTKQGLVGNRASYNATKASMGRVLSTTQSERHELEGEYEDQQAEIQAALQRTNVGTLPAGPVKPGSGQLIWPVNGPVTSPFCERRAWESCHPGIDIGIPSGTPIRAAASGTVALVQSTGVSGGYGNFTCVAHSASLSTCYAHQSSIGVSVGQKVTQGQVIGISGCTGRCYGPHLHFEVRINGAVTNPIAYL